jgi:AraC family transcriptional regulator
LYQSGGAIVRRVIDPSHACVAEHAHAWPMISLFVMGGYHNITERGEREIASPSMVFYRPGVLHRNVVGDAGFEQIEIEFDPAWLGAATMPREEITWRVGGPCASLARRIAAACGGTGLGDERLRAALRELLSVARQAPQPAIPAWAGEITRRLRENPRERLAQLAHDVDRSAAWIGPAYRELMGEGLKEAAARFRVEHAARLLREGDQELIDVALETGFCDQSHMNRLFLKLLGRSPAAVRREKGLFRPGR